MIKLTINRIVQMIPTLVGITVITFLLFHYIGWNVAYQSAGKHSSQEQIQVIEHELGLDQPLLMQYFQHVSSILKLDFGRSWSTHQKVTAMIGDGIGASLSLAIPSFLFCTLLSVSLSLLLAYFRQTIVDRIALFVCLALTSTSSLVYILFSQYFLAYKWGLFPISGWDPSWIGRWQYLALPTVIWIVTSLGSSILFYRTSMLNEVLNDYVRTAKSKGLNNRSIYFKHILKNAMIPIITIVALEFPFLITGSLLLENFFSIPGLGSLTLQALFSADLPVIKAMTILGALVYMAFNLMSDICYSIFDPRVRIK